jgi:hypothetical protein
MAAFFLPWIATPLASDFGRPSDSIGQLERKIGRIKVEVRHAGETHTASLASLADRLPLSLSGFEIPRFANQRDATAPLALAGLLGLAPEALDKRSWLVYAVPMGLAAALGLLSVCGPRRRIALAVLIGCAFAAGVGCWKLRWMQSDALPGALSVGWGLWLSVGAYVLMAFAALLLVASSLGVRPRPDPKGASGRAR